MKKLFVILFITITYTSYAQLNILEKSYDISRKARKGYLGNIESNSEKNTFDMTYVLKSNNRKIITETYTFDKDLNLINTVKDEDEVEKIRTRYKWFRYRGDDYSVKSMYVRSNMKGEMIFREKTVHYRWSWWRGGYGKRISLGEKVKPKDETTGDRYMYRGGYYENENYGDLLVLAGLKEGKDYVASYKNYQILHIDSNVNIKVMATLNFDAAYAPVLSEILSDDDPTSQDEKPRDWILVFAPQGGKMFKGATGNANEYIYVRLSPNGVIKEQYKINVPVAGWRILGAIEKKEQVYLYGPSIAKDNRYSNEIFKGALLSNTTNEDADEQKVPSGGFGGFAAFKAIANIASGEAFQVTQEQIDARLDEMKYSNVQIAALKDGKLNFISAPTISEINDNLITPTGQKKSVKFDGKKFITTGIYVTNNGDIFICGQDWRMTSGIKIKALGIGSDAHRVYEGLFMLQFDANGTYKRNYGLKLDQKKYMGGFTDGLTPNMFPAYSNIAESVDGKKIYWLVSMCKAIDKDFDIDVSYGFATKTTTYSTTMSPLMTIEYGTIDVATGETTDFKTLGEDEKRKYYLMQDINSVRLSPFLIYLSETTKGDKILLSRFDISQ